MVSCASSKRPACLSTCQENDTKISNNVCAEQAVKRTTRHTLAFTATKRNEEPTQTIHHHLTTDEPCRWRQDDLPVGMRRRLTPTGVHDDDHGAGATERCRTTDHREMTLSDNTLIWLSTTCADLTLFGTRDFGSVLTRAGAPLTMLVIDHPHLLCYTE